MKTREGDINALIAGAVYFTIVFAAGFVLGTLRTFLIEPVMGAASAVLVELPFILAISWVACRWTVHRFNAPKQISSRFMMGFSALLFLLSAEVILSVWLSGLSLQQHFTLYLKPAAQLGLIGQLVFAAFPLVQLKNSNR